MVVWLKLIISITLCLVIGFTSSFFTKTSLGSWYTKLKKPSFNPPNWLFGPVWTLLYILMGVTLYILWINNAKLALAFFIAQLVLNFFWTFIFFNLQAPFFAFIEIIVLWITILLTMIFTFSISITAFYLLLPYLLWVTFASILNFAIYSLN